MEEQAAYTIHQYKSKPELEKGNSRESKSNANTDKNFINSYEVGEGIVGRAVSEPGCNSVNSREELRRFGYYLFAPVELFVLAEKIIAEHHSYLEDARIAFLFRSGKWRNKGKVVTGRALVAPPLWRCTSGFELVLIINEILYQSLDEKGREALLDHELSRFELQNSGSLVFGEKTWTIREHDVQEFSDVVKRHGICFTNLQSLLAGQQLQLQSLQSLQEENEDLSADDENEENLFEEENLFFEELE